MFKRYLLLIGLAVFSQQAFSNEQEIQEDFENLTFQCEKKTAQSLVEELNKLQTKLYDNANEVTEEEFTQGLFGDASLDEESRGALYWPYMLYGSPYMRIPSGGQRDTLQEMASSCSLYLYEFETAIKEHDSATADESINAWKSCVWTWAHKTEPAVEKFDACYKKLQKD